MKTLYTEVHGRGNSNKARALGAKAEAAVREQVRMSFVTDAEFRRWEMRGVKRRWDSCMACPRHRHRTRIAHGRGPMEPLVLVVGGDPGEEEDRAGRAFAGPGGKLLVRCCEQVGIDLRADLFLTDLIGCCSIGPATREQREACRPRLEQQAAILQPSGLLLLGRTAMKVLVGIERDASVAEHRGLLPRACWPRLEGSGGWKLRAVFLSHHPVEVLTLSGQARTRALGELVQDLKKLKRVLDKLRARVRRGR